MSDLLQRTLAAAGENGAATVVLIETGKRLWRVVVATGGERPRLVDETEVAALGLKVREESRGRGSQPIASRFGLELAQRLASHAQHALWCQILGSAEQREGWVSP